MLTLAELHKEWSSDRLGNRNDAHLRLPPRSPEGPCYALHCQLIRGLDNAAEVYIRKVWVPRNPRTDYLA